jgi:hypothetical protein
VIRTILFGALASWHDKPKEIAFGMSRSRTIDNSQTLGGFHWNNPREIYVEFRYRFHYITGMSLKKESGHP